MRYDISLSFNLDRHRLCTSQLITNIFSWTFNYRDCRIRSASECRMFWRHLIGLATHHIDAENAEHHCFLKYIAISFSTYANAMHCRKWTLKIFLDNETKKSTGYRPLQCRPLSAEISTFKKSEVSGDEPSFYGLPWFFVVGKIFSTKVHLSAAQGKNHWSGEKKIERKKSLFVR